MNFAGRRLVYIKSRTLFELLYDGLSVSIDSRSNRPDTGCRICAALTTVLLCGLLCVAANLILINSNSPVIITIISPVQQTMFGKYFQSLWSNDVCTEAPISDCCLCGLWSTALRPQSAGKTLESTLERLSGSAVSELHSLGTLRPKCGVPTNGSSQEPNVSVPPKQRLAMKLCAVYIKIKQCFINKNFYWVNCGQKR